MDASLMAAGDGAAYQSSGDGAFAPQGGGGGAERTWARQFLALFVNDLRLIKKRIMATLLYVVAPSLIVLGLWGLDHLVTADEYTDQPVPLTISKCAAFDRFGMVTDARECITVMYAPNDSKHNAMMQQLAADNGLEYGVDVVGKASDVEVAQFVMENLGTVDSAVIFEAPNLRCSDHVAQVQAKCAAPACSGGGAIGELASGVRTRRVDIFAAEGDQCLDDPMGGTVQRMAVGCELSYPSCDLAACKAAICKMTTNLQQADCLHGAADDQPHVSSSDALNDAIGEMGSGGGGGGDVDMADLAEMLQDFVQVASSGGTGLPEDLEESIRQHVQELKEDERRRTDICTDPLTAAPYADGSQSDMLHYEIWYNNTVTTGGTTGRGQSLYSRNELDHVATSTGMDGSRTVALQRAVDQALLADALSLPVDLDVDMRLFAQLQSDDGTYKGDSGVGSFGDLFMSVGCSLSALLVLHTLSGEKADHLLAALRVIGLDECAYWVAWMSAFFVPCVIGALLATITGNVLDIRLYNKCSFSVHFVAMLLFLQSYAAFAACLSSFVKRPQYVNSMTFGLMLFVIIFTQLTDTYEYRPFWDSDSSIFMTAICSLLPFYQYGRIFRAIVAVAYNTEVDAEFGWDDMSTVVNGTYLDERHEQQSYEQFTPFWSMGMMVMNVVFYAGLSWYLGQVAAKDEGGNLKWTFPVSGKQVSSDFTGASSAETDLCNCCNISAIVACVLLSLISFGWLALVCVPLLAIFLFVRLGGIGCVTRMVSPPPSDEVVRPTSTIRGDVIAEERELSRRDHSVRCYKLSKAYEEITALSELTMAVNDGTLLAVLGHNGAGKTTLMKVLLGVHPPTHGEAFIFGLSVRDDLSAIQEVMGCCPQDDVLWTELTARDHLELYARFKGTPEAGLRTAVDTVLASVALLEDADQPVRNFSGGMKRRLSVGIAMIGTPQIIFLDEPTTGMDPLSRRRVWSMIEELKRGRCVFLTTHSMEEADFLGDSIAIMHSGKLRANGSSLFLKNRFGKGHTISLLTDPANADAVEAAARELPGSEILSSAAGNISVSLPRHAASGIPALFQKLMPGAGPPLISEWGISNTTLEEVFLRLCSQNSDINAIAEDIQSDQAMDPDAWMEVLGMLQAAAAAGSAGAASPLSAEEQQVLQRVAELHALLSQSNVAMGRLISHARAVVNEPDAADDDSVQVIAGAGALTMTSSSAQNPAADALADMVQIIVPPGTGPGAQIQVNDPRDPSGTTPPIVVALPAGAVVGQPIQIRLPALATPSSAMGARGPDAVLPTVGGQAFTVLMKSAKLQKSQRKANCCYCCVFVVMLLVNLLAGMLDSFTNQFAAAVQYCPVGDYQKSQINGIETCDLPRLASYMALSSTNTEHMYRFNPSWSYLADSVGESADGKQEPEVRIWTHGDAPDLSIYQDDCFPPDQALTRSACCDVSISDIGDARCWQPPAFTFDRCCARVEVSASSDLNTRIMESQRFIRDSFQNLEDTACDDNWQAGDDNLGYFIENRTQAELEHERLFPSLGVDYAQYSADTAAVRLHYVLQFFQQFRYPGDDQTKYSRIMTTEEEGKYDDDDYDYRGPGGRRGPPGQGGGKGRRRLRGGRGGRGRGRYDDERCDSIEVRRSTLDFYDLFMLENTMANAVLHSQDADTRIEASFVAMPQLTYADNAGVGKTNIQILLFPLTTMILLPSVAQLYTMEREEGLLHVMEMASMQVSSYWAGMYVFTLLYTFTYSILYVATGYVFGLNAFTYPPIGLYILMLLVWSHAQAGIAMFCSAVFTKARMATIVVVLAVLLTSVSGYVITNAMDVWPVWLYVYLPFAYTSAASNLMVYNGGANFYTALAALFFGGSFLIGLVIVDFRVKLKDAFVRKVAGMIRAARQPKTDKGGDGGGDSIAMSSFSTETASAEQEDDDVRREREKVESGDRSGGDAAITINKMKKEFDMGVHLPKKRAVRELCLTINKGEVFGLLGQNGAGKTTTINLLTGLHSIDSGKAEVGGFDAATQQREVHRIIGVCPQFDKVWLDLSVQQHLEFYARVKGIERHQAPVTAREVAGKVGLDGDPYGKLASALSGGMRRRLSIGIALIANPEVLFFDEPTTGLDPDTRRQLWKIIKQEQSDGRCVVITTHSMEEADALCTRIGIMGFGSLRCLGTQVHLKNKFGDGFKLTLNCESEGQDVSALLAEVCEGARLVHALGRQQTFVLPVQNVDVAHLFNTLERQKLRRHGVREWGISQSSLEEVFIKVATASEQTEGVMGSLHD